MEKLRLSLHQIQGLLKGYSSLVSGSTEMAVEKAIKYGTLLSKRVNGMGTLSIKPESLRVSNNPQYKAVKGIPLLASA